MKSEDIPEEYRGCDSWAEAPEKKPCIKEGTYRARCVKYDIVPNFRFNNQREVHLYFQVFCDDQNPENYVELLRFLNYPNKLSNNHDFYKEWLMANGYQHPDRLDRMTPKRFLEKLFWVEIRTVERDYKHRPLKGDLKYSVVGAILELIES